MRSCPSFRCEFNRLLSSLLLLVAALLISGCDGGIFGTGDSNSDELIISAPPPAGTTPEGSDAMAPNEQGADNEVEQGAEADTPDGVIDGPDGDVTPPEQAPGAETGNPETTLSFDNSVAGYPGVEPQLRFVNASNMTVRATLRRTSGEPELIVIAPVSVTRHATLDIGETIIELTPAEERPPAIRIVATLGLSSVSTVFIQSGSSESFGLNVFALETQSTTDDASLAQLRLITLAGNAQLSRGLWSLTPTGMNAGAADATLTAIVDASSDPSYTSVTAGDYELQLDGQNIELPAISLAGGAVTTLVVSGTTDNLQFIEVLDGDIAGL